VSKARHDAYGQADAARLGLSLSPPTNLTGMAAVLAPSLGTTITKVRRHQLAAPQLVVPAFVIRITLRARRVAHVNWGLFHDSEVLGIGWLRHISERNLRLCYDVHRGFLVLRLAGHRA
jgi:hypothetical protein